MKTNDIHRIRLYFALLYGQYYTGSTNDLQKRLAQHEEGLGANFTRKFLPFKLVYVETFKTVDLAFAREKQIQGWSRNKKEALIQSDFNSLKKSAKCKNDSHANSIYSHSVNQNFILKPTRN